MGKTGCFNAQLRSDGESTPGKFASGDWLGKIYGCCDSGGKYTGQTVWGKPAQNKAASVNNPKHLLLKAPHPSPLSAYRGFFGCRHFSRANAFLEENGIQPIDWQIENI